MPGKKETRAEKKETFIERVKRLYTEYRRVMVVTIDHVPSSLMAKIRHSLRGKAEVLCGKNSLIRVALKMIPNAEGTEVLSNAVRQTVGLVFTNGDLKEIRKVIASNRLPAPAKAGQFADNEVIVPKGNTGLEPTQTSFLQALNIATKINKGTVEIINDVVLLKKGQKVGSSEVALLAKLNIMPFFYEMHCKSFFEGGNIFDASVLDITDEALMRSFAEGVANVSGLALSTNIPTLASLPYILSNGFRNVAGIAFATDYKFPLAERLTSAAAAVAPAAAAAAAPAPAKEEKEEKKPEKKEEEEEVDLGMGGLFD